MSSKYLHVDQLMEQANPDYFRLYNQLLQMSTAESAAADVELWWRFAKVTYLTTHNFKKDETERIQQKLTEAKKHAEKALALAPNHFGANLWMAMALGKLSLLEENMQRMMDLVAPMLKHLSVCEAQLPEEPMVLYLNARIKVSLGCFCDEVKSAIMKNPATAHLFPVDHITAELKLRRAIELKPQFLELYLTLAHLLGHHMDKPDQAREVALKGLQLPRYTAQDWSIASSLEKIAKESHIH